MISKINTAPANTSPKYKPLAKEGGVNISTAGTWYSVYSYNGQGFVTGFRGLCGTSGWHAQIRLTIDGTVVFWKDSVGVVQFVTPNAPYFNGTMGLLANTYQSWEFKDVAAYYRNSTTMYAYNEGNVSTSDCVGLNDGGNFSYPIILPVPWYFNSSVNFEVTCTSGSANVYYDLCGGIV